MENKFENNLDLRKILIIVLAVSFAVLTVLDLSLNKKAEVNIGAVINKLASAMTYVKVQEVEGTQKLITRRVYLGDYSYEFSKAIAIGSNTNNYSRVNNVIQTGTYIEECILPKKRRNCNNKIHKQ